MRNIFLFILSVFVFITAGGTTVSAQFTSDSLKYLERDVSRPVGFITEHSRWNTASTDLYTYWIDNGLYGYYGPSPSVQLDGIPMDSEFFGWRSLNMLPLHVDEVLAVESRFLPGVHNATLSPGGLVNFKSFRPDTGWAVTISGYVGNETGDPGPWVYDSARVTPNVDRWGPDAGAVFSYRRKEWYGKGVFQLRRHQQTDLISHSRLHTNDYWFGATRFYPIQTTSMSGLAESGYRTDDFEVRVRGVHGEENNYLFFQPFGREIPVKAVYDQLAIQGSYRSGYWNISSRYILDSKSLGRHNLEHSYIFDWDERQHNITGTASYEDGRIGLQGGILYEVGGIEAPGFTSEKNHLTTLFLKGEYKMGIGGRLSLHSNLDLNGSNTAKTIRAGFRTNLAGSWTGNLAILYSELLPDRRASFAYWITRGYNFDEELGITRASSLTVAKERLISIILTNEFKLPGQIAVELTQQYTEHFGLAIPWQSVEYHPRLSTEPGEFTQKIESGIRLSLGSTLTHHPANWLNHQVSIHIQQTLEGSARYRDYFEQIHELKLDYRIEFIPTSNLALSMNTSYRPSTRWNEFEALEGMEYRGVNNLYPVPVDTFHVETPSYINIGVSAKKWLWSRRIGAQFSIQNLLNQEVRMHPMGAEQALIFNIRLTLKL